MEVSLGVSPKVLVEVPPEAPLGSLPKVSLVVPMEVPLGMSSCRSSFGNLFSISLGSSYRSSSKSSAVSFLNYSSANFSKSFPEVLEIFS